jgi:hypothetical protein
MGDNCQPALDIVYMWVDDSWPGYSAELNRYARTGHDTNPNRTRNNLETLKYSLRSIERFAPWRGRIYLVSCRPQVPAWLNLAHPEVHVVHHDEFIPKTYLPTFNSFAIQSWLYKLPGLSEQFVCFDDDTFFMREAPRDLFFGQDERLRYHFAGRLPRRRRVRRKGTSPWTNSLVNSADLLNEIVRGPHPGFIHGAKLFRKRDCEEVIARWPDIFEQTWRSRFRAHNNVSLDALLPQYAVAMGRAEAAGPAATRAEVAYLGLEKSALWNRFWLGAIGRRRPIMVTLNDNFGPCPQQGAVEVARRFLEAILPGPSGYEISDFERQS